MSERRYGILLVGLKRKHRTRVEALLAEAGQWQAEVIRASGRDQALERIASGGIDVALVAHHRRRPRGLDLLSEPLLRRAQVPVVVLTEDASPEIDRAAQEAGAHDSLSIPELTAATLERSIRYTVENSRRHRAERLYRALVENSRDLITLLNDDATIRYASPSLSRILGLDPDAMIGANAIEEVHPDDRSQVRLTFEHLIAKPRTVHRLQYRVRHRDGTWRVLDTVSQNLLEDPLIRGIIVNAWDVTELRRAQDNLAETAGLLEQTLGSLEDAVFTVDQRTRTILRANDSTFAMFGCTAGELIGASARTIHVGDDDFDEFGRAIRENLRTAGRFHGQITLRRRDGSTFPAEFTISPLRPDEGADGRVVAVVRDVSRRLEEERRLTFQSALLDCVGQPVLAVDRDARITYWNQACEDLIGWTRDEMLGESVLDRIVRRADRKIGKSARQAALAGETWTGELTIQSRDGQERIVSATVTPAVNPDGSPGGRIGAGVDITALRTAEEERRREAERVAFQARLLDAVGQAVIATDLEGRVTYWNHAAEELYGWTSAEAVGRGVRDLIPGSAAGQAAEVLAVLRHGATWSGEIEARRKDGTGFPALVTEAPIVDTDGRLVGIVGVSSDLTERRELEAQLRQAQKMEAIGRLAGGVAHDFNNLLTAINGHCGMMLDDLPADSPFRADVQQILNSGERAAALTRQLLAFSRKQVLEQRAVDLRQLILGMEQMLRRLIPERIAVDIEVGERAIVVRADADQIGQVVMNLVVNAGDAIEDAGRITIRLDALEVTPEMAEAIPWTIAPGEYAQLLVEDTGAGIPAHLIDQIFEPFFTTKPEGKGTGLGLSTVYGITKQSGGHVMVDSREARGTTFRVLFPLTDEPPAGGAGNQGQPAARRGATVLLVEDDGAVRNLARRVLQRLGYEVVVATNGREALDSADAAAGSIDLAASEAVMPEMSGVELMERLRERHPGLRVVLTSGYSEADLRGEVRHQGAAFLVKPFSPEALARVVAEALSD